ncbi:hypothetical protein P280DRAFT_508998 [Massarina eburnea CBS 473.64]|uniref:Uncharacterized protein n=1 Tax=Massarina eburnea CBS 473.64 TaxID=1395130 RepID=A0A6A6RT74_9PLEO|nr:hypothetical protein P280DRAFT_508998 [Massarina eburnea CBS 473.64]
MVWSTTRKFSESRKLTSTKSNWSKIAFLGTQMGTQRYFPSYLAQACSTITVTTVDNDQYYHSITAHEPTKLQAASTITPTSPRALAPGSYLTLSTFSGSCHAHEAHPVIKLKKKVCLPTMKVRRTHMSKAYRVVKSGR